ncbi:ergothioneine biosynthesis protein EgtB [Thiohalomonas denitrificans]|uniref:ergothioneine biosynthesis protein EgtB n=1 Tax=Thiohalomonas denitrificans TaxID=415747 RepID=UPI0026ED5709|nr:ergothioneine biosynthesis protein EgtB [Thiohalomonas denitrificans]
MPRTEGLGAIDDERERFINRYRGIREASEQLCRPLATEDYVVQTIPEASPPKWHLAHVTWFFETFLLKAFVPHYRPFHPRFEFMFNSYYNSVGAQWPRSRRGELSRPTVEEVYAYRACVDEAIASLVGAATAADWTEVAWRLLLGMNHEQQHQELLLADLKQNLSLNPLYPAYREDLPAASGRQAPALSWLHFEPAEISVGYSGDGFSFDNERPQHRVLLEDFWLASRPVTNYEFLAFVEEGGYSEPSLWLSDGWSVLQARDWHAPLHWRLIDGQWFEYTLAGLLPLNGHEPVSHVSYFEADAYAAWAGKRLPSEEEWEQAAIGRDIDGNFRENGKLHPEPAEEGRRQPLQLFGDVWEWTRSPYGPYPGYRRGEGAFGEYNGKFMCNQMVVRGGSCVTPRDHFRASYRNFFYPHDRWQFLGIRLAEDA